MNRDEIIKNCRILLVAYQNGELGQTKMPEESHPVFADNEIEERLVYFTLPMALNYQRDSYKLWQAALATYNDQVTKKVFSLSGAAVMNSVDLRECLTKYKLALQPNRHIEIWQKIAKTIFQKWQTLENLLQAANYDFLNQELTSQEITDFFSEVNTTFGTSFSTWDDIRNNWRDEYAYLLVQFEVHPEYCLYTSCKAIEPTYEFDYQMLASENGVDARQNGYFNPIGSNANVTDFPAPSINFLKRSKYKVIARAIDINQIITRLTQKVSKYFPKILFSGA